MRRMGMKADASHNMIVWIIIGVLVLIVLVFFSRQMAGWISQAIDKVFGW